MAQDGPRSKELPGPRCVWRHIESNVCLINYQSFWPLLHLFMDVVLITVLTHGIMTSLTFDFLGR